MLHTPKPLKTGYHLLSNNIVGGRENYTPVTHLIWMKYTELGL